MNILINKFFLIIKKILKKFHYKKRDNFNHSKLKLLVAKTVINNFKLLNSNNINENEFSAFSQFGEDGIIQYLISNLDIKYKTFIEFGVENYEEANTRLLLENNCWSGLVLDSSKKNIDYIKKKDFYWKHSLEAKCKFIDQDNIEEIIQNSGFAKNLGLLSIDIDGNDYWIWKAINNTYPDIVVIEYNARFGDSKSLTINYQKKFSRNNFGLERIVYGASLKALYELGQKKGYDLVATNKNGNNAFFVKKEKLINSNLNAKLPEECFHINSFSELIDENGCILKDRNLETEYLKKSSVIKI